MPAARPALADSSPEGPVDLAVHPKVAAGCTEQDYSARLRAVEDELIRAVLESSGRLALVCRLLHYRQKGLVPTDRALDQWRRARLETERRAWARNAAGLAASLEDEADWNSLDALDRWSKILKVLTQLIEIKVNRRPGRKPTLKPGGLLAQVAVRRPIGRPRTLADEDEDRWVRYVYGIKLELYEEFRGGRRSRTSAEAVKRLLRDPDRDPSLSVAKALDFFVPDTTALATTAAQMRMPGKPGSLAKRLQRAMRAIRRPPLPLPGSLKSGGD